MAHRRHSPARRKRTRKSWFAMGALLGALPPLRLGAQSTPPEPALPVEHRIVLDRRKVEAALAHVKIWTPSETLLTAPAVAAQDQRERLLTHAPADEPSGHATVEQGAPVFRFAYCPWPARAGTPSVRIDNRLRSSSRARSDRQPHDRRGHRYVDRGAGARSAAVRHEPVVPRRRREDVRRGDSPLWRRRPGHGRVGETELRQVHGATQSKRRRRSRSFPGRCSTSKAQRP